MRVLRVLRVLWRVYTLGATCKHLHAGSASADVVMRHVYGALLVAVLVVR